MTTTRRDLLAGAGATLMFAGAPAGALAGMPATAFATGADADAKVQALLDRIAEMLLKDQPESATNLGLDKDRRAQLKHRLGDRSAKGQRAIAANIAKAVNDLKAVNVEALSPVMRVNVDVVRTSFESALEGFAFKYGDVAVGGWRNTPYVVIQNVGAFLDVPRFLDTDHTVKTRDDAEAYLDRLDSYAEQLDGETERLKIAAAEGVIAPDFNLDKAIRQLKLARGGNIAGWGLVTSLANRSAGLGGDYGQRAFDIASRSIAPALDRQIAELEKQRAKATSDAGVWKFKDGDAYYAWALSAATTTKRSPDEIHKQGQDELAKLQAEMDVILKAQGYTQGTVGARMTALGKDERFLFQDNDTGRAEIMAFIQKHLDDIRSRMPRAFNTLVKGNVEVRRLPPEEEPGAPGAYGGAGSIDGTVPGRFWINLRTTHLHSKYSLPTLTFHEAIPGHVWQGDYTRKLPLARTLLSFNAYSEGWALYGEQLANELGVYDDDPIGRLGYLQSIAFRACRLVVDTGLHAKRWTRQQAIEWFATTNGSGIEEVTSEVDRYCSWPGQACGYKIGHSEINRLRDHAKADLGERYDFKAFNDAVVMGGNVPMTVLGRVIDRHIAERKA